MYMLSEDSSSFLMNEMNKQLLLNMQNGSKCKIYFNSIWITIQKYATVLLVYASCTYLSCSQILCIFFFTGCREEHNVINSLNKLQLHHTPTQPSLEHLLVRGHLCQ